MLSSAQAQNSLAAERGMEDHISRVLVPRSHRFADRRSKVTAEQMEISRLRAELARVTMERDILGKAMAYFAKGQK